MTTTAQVQLDLNSEDRFLIGNVSNEVLNGFRIENFDVTIGSTRDEYQDMSQRLFKQQRFQALVGHKETVLLRNALAATLAELGLSEFQTRTGCDYEYGQALLKRMESAMSQVVRG